MLKPLQFAVVPIATAGEKIAKSVGLIIGGQ
jgi:hypothetical protein